MTQFISWFAQITQTDSTKSYSHTILVFLRVGICQKQFVLKHKVAYFSPKKKKTSVQEYDFVSIYSRLQPINETVKIMYIVYIQHTFHPIQ